MAKPRVKIPLDPVLTQAAQAIKSEDTPDPQTPSSDPAPPQES
ncbi:hypothetical protein [Nonomuraea sp. NPDC050310]